MDRVEQLLAGHIGGCRGRWSSRAGNELADLLAEPVEVASPDGKPRAPAATRKHRLREWDRRARRAWVPLPPAQAALTVVIYPRRGRHFLRQCGNQGGGAGVRG
jgi:hypothetical protein